MSVTQVLVAVLGVLAISAPAMGDTRAPKPTVSPTKPRVAPPQPANTPTVQPTVQTRLPAGAQQKTVPFLDKKAVLSAAMSKLPTNRRLTSSSTPTILDIDLRTQPTGTGLIVYGATRVGIGNVWAQHGMSVHSTSSEVFEPRGNRLEVRFPVRRLHLYVLDCIVNNISRPVHYELRTVAADGDNDNWIVVEARNMVAVPDDRLLATFQAAADGMGRISIQGFAPSGTWAPSGCRVTSFRYE
jgi:hypothetical protein